MLQPPFDNVILRTWFHSGHLEYNLRRMPRPLHVIEAPKAQPDYSSMLLQRHIASLPNDRIFGQLSLVLPPLVDNDSLVLIEERQLLSYLVHSTTLLMSHLLLLYKGIGTNLRLLV